MRRIIAVLATTVIALVMAVPSFASYQDGNGDFRYLWWEASITYRSDGFPIFLYCLYGDTGTFTVQIQCHD